VKLLLHLKENRIFYFMLAASLLVLVIMMQIRTAYRSYDDN
jgi:glycosyltransferase involved in cell wall biosynthesis